MQLRGVSWVTKLFVAALVIAGGITFWLLSERAQAGAEVARLQQEVQTQQFPTTSVVAQPILTAPQAAPTSTDEVAVATSSPNQIQTEPAQDTTSDTMQTQQPQGPALTSLTAQRAQAGEAVTIYGSGLAGAQVVLTGAGGRQAGSVALPTSGASDTAVQFTVPSDVRPGHYLLYVSAGGASAGPLDFFVR